MSASLNRSPSPTRYAFQRLPGDSSRFIPRFQATTLFTGLLQSSKSIHTLVSFGIHLPQRRNNIYKHPGIYFSKRITPTLISMQCISCIAPMIGVSTPPFEERQNISIVLCTVYDGTEAVFGETAQISYSFMKRLWLSNTC